MSDHVPMTLPDLTLAIHDTPYGHQSSYVELADGAILHAASGIFTQSDDGGLTWSEPFERRDTNGDLVGNPHGAASLVRLDGTGIGLASDIRPGSEAGVMGDNHIVFWRSEDGGETWTPPVRVTPPGINSYVLQDVLLRMASGRLVLPVYIALGVNGKGPANQTPPVPGKLVRGQFVSTDAHYFDTRFLAVYVCYSDDQGRTWRRNRDGELFILRDWNSDANYVCEPAVAEVTPGRLLMLMRTGMGRLFESWSEDGGETWMRPQPTSLASDPSPAQIRALPNGHLLAVWNQHSADEIRRGYTRTRLSSAISRNGGSVWEFFQNVESIHEQVHVEPEPVAAVRPAERFYRPGVAAPERPPAQVEAAEAMGRWSYPSVLVLSNRVLIAHTYSIYDDHPEQAKLERRGPKPGMSQKLKVLPLRWFYGGKEPAENPNLKNLGAPARP